MPTKTPQPAQAPIVNHPDVRVFSNESTSMENFPSTLEVARKNVHMFITEQLQDGYIYSGTLQRYVGGEERSFMVFYHKSVLK